MAASDSEGRVYQRRGRRSTADQRLADYLYTHRNRFRNDVDIFEDDDFFGEDVIGAAAESKEVTQRDQNEEEVEEEEGEFDKVHSSIVERQRRKLQRPIEAMMTMKKTTKNERAPRRRGRDKNKARNKSRKIRDKSKNKSKEQPRLFDGEEERFIDDKIFNSERFG